MNLWLWTVALASGVQLDHNGALSTLSLQPNGTRQYGSDPRAHDGRD
jgi:hypothetical protein